MNISYGKLIYNMSIKISGDDASLSVGIYETPKSVLPNEPNLPPYKAISEEVGLVAYGESAGVALDNFEAKFFEMYPERKP